MDSHKGMQFSFAEIKVKPKKEPQLKREAEKEQHDKCSICWTKPPINAIKLECGHVFCFLCIKSVATATRRCALCRAEIQEDLDLGEFDLIGDPRLPAGSEDGYFWFYEGRRGWWLYDADTNHDLEEAYKNGEKKTEKLISGRVYVISLLNLRQYQKSDQSKSRLICRDTLDLEDILGMAGIRNETILDRIRPRQHQMQNQQQQQSESNLTRIDNLRP